MGKTITEETEISNLQTPVDMRPQTYKIVTVAELQQEYVAGGTGFFATGGAYVQPWNFDDLTRDFGDTIYDRMLWDASVKAAHTTWKKSVLADGVQIQPKAQDPMQKWRADRRAALDAHQSRMEQKQAAIDGAKPDPLHVEDPNNPTPAAMIPAPQPKIPDKPKPVSQQEEIAQFCERLLARVEPPIQDVLNDMADAAALGVKVAELVWEYVAAGKDQGRWMIKSIKVKPRRSLAFVVDRFLNIVGFLNIKPGMAQPNFVGGIYSPVQAQLAGENKDMMLPREKFAMWTHEPVASDPRGTSHLRAAYTAWWGKMQLYPEYLKYLAQFGSPSLIGYTPPGASTVTDLTGGTPRVMTAQQAMVNTLTTFRSGSAMSFAYGAKVETLLANVASRSFTEDFMHFNDEIFTSILTFNPNSPRQGRGESQAHQDTLAEIVRDAKLSLARMIVRDILTPAVVYNFGEDTREMVPDASLGGGNQPDLAALQVAAAQAGYTLSPSQFPGLDAKFGYPSRSQDEVAALIERAMKGQDVSPAPSDGQPRPSGGGQPPGQDNNSRGSDTR